jgi:hypothetical protein
MLPPFGEMLRNGSMTKHSSGVKGVPAAWSELPSIVFLNQACASGAARACVRLDRRRGGSTSDFARDAIACRSAHPMASHRTGGETRG